MSTRRLLHVLWRSTPTRVRWTGRETATSFCMGLLVISAPPRAASGSWTSEASPHLSLCPARGHGACGRRSRQMVGGWPMYLTRQVATTSMFDRSPSAMAVHGGSHPAEV